MKHFYPDGKFEPVTHGKAIGAGAPYGLLFLMTYWQSINHMEAVAHLGYFIIKIIEQFKLNDTVGLASGDPRITSYYPQIWFVPDASNETFQILDKPKMIARMEKNVNAEIVKFKNSLRNLFPIDTPPDLQHLVDELQKRLVVSDSESSHLPNEGQSR